MTIPAEDVHSAADWLFSFVDELRELPHVKSLTEITALWNALNEQKKQKLWPEQEDLGLQSLKNTPPNFRRLAAKWKKSRLRLLFEPSTVVEDLSNTFIEIRKHFDQLQVSSQDQIVEQLGKVIKDLNDGGACNELKRAEDEFRKLFFQFFHEKRSRSDTSEDSMSFTSWLGRRLDTDAGSIKQELEEVQDIEGSFLGVLWYIAELEDERKCTSDGRASSDANPEERIFDKPVAEVSHNAAQALRFDKPLNEVARDAVQALGLKRIHWVLMGFEDLIRCTKLPKGKLEVYKANAIPEAIRLAQTEKGLYTHDAMTLLEALTSSNGADEDNVRSCENREIYLHISDHLDFLIDLMKTHEDLKIRLLAAETVVNMLVNYQVWKTVRIQYDIVSALVAITNEDVVDRNEYRDRADHVCLVGLSHLKEFSTGRIEVEIKSANEKTQNVVLALIKLLSDGLKETVLRNLAKDTLVALDTQVLLTGRRTPTREIWLKVQSELLKLMVTDDLISHTTIPGRMAIMSMMRKLCDLYKEGITEDLFSYLLKMMRTTGREAVQLSNSRPNEENAQKVNDLKQILDLAVKLFCQCVTRGKDQAQAVLTQNVAERRTLEVMLEEQNSGILDESKLEILEILDKIDMPSSSQGATAAGELAVLIKMAKSPSPVCRAQVASRLLKLVKERLDEIDIEVAKAALMDLLNKKEVDCQKDALLALYLLSPRIAIQTKELPLEIILGFLHPKWPSDLRDAAVGFLDLMVKKSAPNAKKFMETPAALKAVLHCLDIDAENLSCQKSVSALLIMATEEDGDVRLAIATSGLSTLVKFVQRLGTIEHKRLLTIMLGLLCKSGAAECEETVTRANGHTFLLSSLEEKISMDAAAQGLLILLKHSRTRGDVLQAGFVEIAMGSIDRENASTVMALGLASVCSSSDGLDQIVACSGSVKALLILLERCPTTDGKGAVAAVIAKLYPRLNSNEGVSRQMPDLTDACSYLIKYLDEMDRSQHQEFLKALAAFATVKKGRQTIHEERGQTPLMRFLKDREIDTQVRDLVLQILAKMSSVFADGVTIRDSSYHKILNVFLDFKIGVLLCELFENDEFRTNTESMKNMLILIRNLSLAGPAACSHLSDAGAVNLLLKVLSDHGSPLSTVTELAVKALVKFMDDADDKKAFLNGGIRSLVSILKTDAASAGDRNLTTIIPIILASVAQDPRTSGAACAAIYNCEILPALNTIMYDGETSRIKWQAAVLIKLLATNGPTRHVCASIFKAGTLDALIYLRQQNHCEDIANDVLKFLRGRNSDCKKYIDDNLRRPR